MRARKARDPIDTEPPRKAKTGILEPFFSLKNFYFCWLLNFIKAYNISQRVTDLLTITGM